MQFQGFKPEAMQRIAGTMGYNGDMSKFGNFLNENPNAKKQMNMFNQKAVSMMNGGMVRKNYHGGGMGAHTHTLSDEVGIAWHAENPTWEPKLADETADETTGDSGTNVATGISNTPEIKKDTIDRLTNPAVPEGGAVTAEGVAFYDEQDVKDTAGKVSTVDPRATAGTGTAGTATAEGKTDATTYDATTSKQEIDNEVDKTVAEQGTVSEEARVTAARGSLTDGALPAADTFDDEYLNEVTSGERKVSSEEIAVAQGLDEKAVKAKIAKAEVPDNIIAATTTVKPEEIPDAAQIEESEMAFATAQTDAGLSEDATAVAAKMKAFNLDDETLAEFKEGKIEAEDTVQGQLASLMASFDDGTPAWAAGAMRAANAAMAARGMGGSSMAAAAIVQASMESAIPIATQDAQAFRNMKLDNLGRQQQVSLSNAAAQQGVQLQNFTAEQQTSLQNSQNAFSLQGMNLSNKQAVVLANAQIKASLQGQNLSNRQQANIVEAARYAEVSNINLNNRQQGLLQDNANELNVNLANLNSEQQAYIANAQIAAALQGKKMDNMQQAAMQKAAVFSNANNLTFTAGEQAKLHNSELMKTIGLANLNSAQANTLQKAAQIASMDMANLNNRQQAAVTNAQSFLAMDMTNLNNRQQTEMFRAQSRVQSLFTDQAADNASKQFNATSQTQNDQFFANLKTQTSQFNTSQKNAMDQFNTGEANAVNKFNTEISNQRDQFNASNGLVIAQSNATWRREIATADTSSINRANELNATNILDMSNQAYSNLWQEHSDLMEWAWTSSDNERDRQNAITMSHLAANINRSQADYESDLAASNSMGDFVGNLLTSAVASYFEF